MFINKPVTFESKLYIESFFPQYVKGGDFLVEQCKKHLGFVPTHVVKKRAITHVGDGEKFYPIDFKKAVKEARIWPKFRGNLPRADWQIYGVYYFEYSYPAMFRDWFLETVIKIGAYDEIGSIEVFGHFKGKPVIVTPVSIKVINHNVRKRVRGIEPHWWGASSVDKSLAIGGYWEATPTGWKKLPQKVQKEDEELRNKIHSLEDEKGEIVWCDWRGIRKEDFPYRNCIELGGDSRKCLHGDYVYSHTVGGVYTVYKFPKEWFGL
jgi:hypothetical protein